VGGNIATNGGGMMAVKYRVTRHFVLVLKAILPTGEIIRTEGKYVKASSGYDLTQLLVGSEGTLAVITKAILKLVRCSKAKMTLFAFLENSKMGLKRFPLYSSPVKSPTYG